MAMNVEVKVRVTDLERAMARLEKLSEQPIEQIEQEDVFFRVRSGRLKLRRQSDKPAELIYYERENHGAPRLSVYSVIRIPDAELWETVLARELGVLGRVRKTRLFGKRGRTRLHLDRVEGLGWFFELEVVLQEDDDLTEAVQEAETILKAMALDKAPRIGGAYLDLLQQRGGA